MARELSRRAFTVSEQLAVELGSRRPAASARFRAGHRVLEVTECFDAYWRFASERQRIFHCRANGMSAPWTTDPILARHKFTSVYRAADRVSQYLIREVIYAGPRDPQEVVFRILLFKLFNKIETWELLTGRLGARPSWAGYDIAAYDRILGQAISSGLAQPNCAHGSRHAEANHRVHANDGPNVVPDFRREDGDDPVRRRELLTGAAGIASALLAPAARAENRDNEASSGFGDLLYGRPAVRRAAARQGTSVSTWLTEAAADKLRNELLSAALDQWETEDGPFTQAELDEAASRLGLAPRSNAA